MRLMLLDFYIYIILNVAGKCDYQSIINFRDLKFESWVVHSIGVSLVSQTVITSLRPFLRTISNDIA